ncbi:MAG: MerR family transcriptional regulator [Lachnospiraceae bacterium]|nr:MerR family transcriptional regulator [Lachnospiraceae bacterium]
MKINEVEQAIGITKKNIRFYEQQGLLSPSRNAGNGYRDYSEEDVYVLQQIKLLRKLGIPIEEIRKLQSKHLTLEDCLKRHLITLERESKNLNSIQDFCKSILSTDASLDTLPVTQLLSDMENMEDGGTRFMDIKKNDKKLLKKNALVAATSAILIMVIPIILVIWVILESEDNVPFGVIFLLALITIGGVIGTLLALKERFKEIEGGELDEASKY